MRTKNSATLERIIKAGESETEEGKELFEGFQGALQNDPVHHRLTPQVAPQDTQQVIPTAAALRAAIREGDCSGIVKGNPFARVRAMLKL